MSEVTENVLRFLSLLAAISIKRALSSEKWISAMARCSKCKSLFVILNFSICEEG